MDSENPKTELQSDTIRSALKGIAINLLALITVATGKTFGVDAINTAIDYGVTLIVNAISIYYGFRAINGRINATQTIKAN